MVFAKTDAILWFKKKEMLGFLAWAHRSALYSDIDRLGPLNDFI